MVPWGRGQPDTDLFEPGRLEGSRVTLGGRNRKERGGEGEGGRGGRTKTNKTKTKDENERKT